MKIFKVFRCIQRKVWWSGKNGMTLFRTSLTEVLESLVNFVSGKGGMIFIILIL